MSHTPPNTKPTPRRFAAWRFVFAPFRRLYRWYSHQPRALRLGLAITLLAAAISGGVYARYHLKKRADVQAVASAWRDFDTAARQADIPAMHTALDRVAAANPSDPLPARYRAMLDSGTAADDAPEMAVVLLADHVRNDRLAEAAREAKKVLTKYPKDWQSLCCQAHYALQMDRNPTEAQGFLARLPSPEDPEGRVTIGGVLYALRLSDALGRDASTLRRVILRRLVPVTRSAAASTAPPGAKAQLVTLYLEPFSDSTALTELADFWAAADKLAEEAVTDAAEQNDIATLIRMAELGPRTRAALAALRENDPTRVTPERYALLRKAIDDRTQRAWQAVREKAPQRPESYRGLAFAALEANNPAQATRNLLDGLAACGDRPELLELLVLVITRFGTDESVQQLADAIWNGAAEARTDVNKWCLAAEVALALNRADAALLACRNARQLVPKHPWACATEARLLTRAGKFLEARESLALLGDEILATNPILARLHARILVGSGLWVLRDDAFKKLTESPARSRNPAADPAVYFLLGVLDAPANADRAAWVAAQAELLLANDPNAPLIGRIKVDALYRLAELSARSNPKDPALPPVWDSARVTAALRAIGQLAPNDRVNPDIMAATAALELKGSANPVAALRTAGALLSSEASLTPAQLEVLGAVLIANDRTADAIRVLQIAVDSPRPSAGSLVALAVALHKNRQPIEAQAALATAETIAERSDREQAELITAKLLLKRDKP